MVPIATLCLAFYIPGQFLADEPELFSAEDSKLLATMIDSGLLVDPVGKEFISWKSAGSDRWSIGWLDPAVEGEPTRRFRTYNNVPYPLTNDYEWKLGNFEAYCQKYLEDKEVADNRGQSAFRLTFAAVAYRLGMKQTAAELLKLARKGEEDPHAVLIERLGFFTWVHGYFGFQRGDDADALANLVRINNHFPDVAAKANQLPHLIDELKRRLAVKEDSFSAIAQRKEPPQDFASWDQQHKEDFLIVALEEISDHRSHTGHQEAIDLSPDWRAAVLIRHGESLVPRLLDAAENDTRLTRLDNGYTVDNGGYTAIKPVKELALELLYQVLRVRHVDPLDLNADDFDAPFGFRSSDETPLERHERRVRKVREYWEEFGDSPIEQRLMHTLTHPRASNAAIREAAERISNLDADPAVPFRIQTLDMRRKLVREPDEVVGEFHDPTIAEALLKAMDSEIAEVDEFLAAIREMGNENDYEVGNAVHRQSITEDTCLISLIDLGDRSVLKEIDRRLANNPHQRLRRKLAYVKHWFGDSEPIDRFAADAAKGGVSLPKRFPNYDARFETYHEQEYAEIRGIVSYLMCADTPTCRQAITALTKTDHPLNPALVRLLTTKYEPSTALRREWPKLDDLKRNPLWLQLLANQLSNEVPTGWTFAFDHDWQRVMGDERDNIRIPANLKVDETRRFKERYCDLAAVELSENIWGAPEFHPLFPDADLRLQRLREFVSRFESQLRPNDETNRRFLGYSLWRREIPALLRPATPADVDAGKAVFAINQPTKIAKIDLPAIGKLGIGDEAETVLVVQAEEDANGGIMLGAIGEHDIRKVPRDSVIELKPLMEK